MSAMNWRESAEEQVLSVTPMRSKITRTKVDLTYRGSGSYAALRDLRFRVGHQQFGTRHLAGEIDFVAKSLGELADARNYLRMEMDRRRVRGLVQLTLLSSMHMTLRDIAVELAMAEQPIKHYATASDKFQDLYTERIAFGDEHYGDAHLRRSECLLDECLEELADLQIFLTLAIDHLLHMIARLEATFVMDVKFATGVIGVPSPGERSHLHRLRDKVADLVDVHRRAGRIAEDIEQTLVEIDAVDRGAAIVTARGTVTMTLQPGT